MCLSDASRIRTTCEANDQRNRKRDIQLMPRSIINVDARGLADDRCSCRSSRHQRSIFHCIGAVCHRRSCARDGRSDDTASRSVRTRVRTSDDRRPYGPRINRSSLVRPPPPPPPRGIHTGANFRSLRYMTYISASTSQRPNCFQTTARRVCQRPCADRPRAAYSSIHNLSFRRAASRTRAPTAAGRPTPASVDGRRRICPPSPEVAPRI